MTWIYTCMRAYIHHTYTHTCSSSMTSVTGKARINVGTFLMYVLALYYDYAPALCVLYMNVHMNESILVRVCVCVCVNACLKSCMFSRTRIYVYMYVLIWVRICMYVCVCCDSHVFHFQPQKTAMPDDINFPPNHNHECMHKCTKLSLYTYIHAYIHIMYIYILYVRVHKPQSIPRKHG
jgi:hypothetical protein